MANILAAPGLIQSLGGNLELMILTIVVMVLTALVVKVSLCEARALSSGDVLSAALVAYTVPLILLVLPFLPILGTLLGACLLLQQWWGVMSIRIVFPQGLRNLAPDRQRKIKLRSVWAAALLISGSCMVLLTLV
ncbi:MAG: hypothetical protein ACYTHJ_03885 [Planctomycetota bacterium]